MSIKKLPLILLIALSLAACGGGGGSSSSSNNSGTGGSNNNSTTTAAPNSTHFAAIRASSVWAAGGTGAGVIVAVSDTGLNAHPEFGSRISADSAYATVVTDPATGQMSVNMSNAAADYRDVNGHGTHVASIAVGANVGVAPKATLIGMRTWNDAGRAGETPALYSVNYMITRGARVINMSNSGWLVATHDEIQMVDPNTGLLFWPVGTSDLDRLRAIPANNALLVVAAGNSSQDLTASIASSLVAGSTLRALAKDVDHTDMSTNTWVQGMADNYIIVGASDDSGTLLPISNYPGTDVDMQNHFMVAPGGDVVGASADTSVAFNYMTATGTSQAAPFISGAAAALMSLRPAATAEDIARILLASANRSFSGYDPRFHGRGLLDLQAATAQLLTEFP